jgi:Na+-transporting methylmalonyl-CoA/oxaloacetate decarboxylase gamma subunit
MKTLRDALDLSTPAGFVFLVLLLFAVLSAAGIALHRAFTRPARPPNVIPYRKQVKRRHRPRPSRYRTVLVKYRTPLFIVLLGLCAALVSPSFPVAAEPI